MRVALLYMFSVPLMSFLRYCDQIHDPYSNVGLTSDLYKCKNISFSRCSKYLWIHPRQSWALLIIAVICCSNVRLQ